MKFAEFFDPWNTDHIRAFDTACQKGMWPVGFLPPDIDMGALWIVTAMTAISAVYCDVVLGRKALIVVPASVNDAEPVEEPTLEPPRPRHWADGASNDPDTAEESWTKSEERMPAVSYAIKNTYAVRGINVDGVKLCRSVHGHWGDQLWADQYGDTFSIAGTEWRPAREE